ncbi:uncharacterized protein LOC114828627 [Galendromus occidentalis]|uniref:Uncharacterized protein LOC114828627 n=1 Tax=Galendromus occidentalis TaxID=34638 RepID=A0AAJ7WJ96_9ACAR|nr:uncharacterized protein LOC114828627 [Galendromus occidentalis]
MRPQYEILLRADVLQSLSDYRDALLRKSAEAGSHFGKLLKEKQLEDLSTESMLELLLQTKKPLFFAKRSLKGDGSDWTPAEVRILGNVCLGVEVTVFDNGCWKPKDAEFKTHAVPFTAHLVFVPGPLLTGSRSPDYTDLVEGERLNSSKYFELMKRRLEPAFDFINSKSSQERKALVVIPGIGCGLFGGKFTKELPSILEETIARILHQNHQRWLYIKCTTFVPFDGEMKSTSIGKISYRVRPHLKHKTPMLSETKEFEEGSDDFSKDHLFKLVAWDHFSYPGNNFFRCKRQTDDGVSAAATDCMARVLGVYGHYDGRGRYMPPKQYESWESVVKANHILLEVKENLRITPNVEFGTTSRREGNSVAESDLIPRRLM